MKTKKHQHFFIASKNQGFTIIEALTVLFIFSLITTTFYSLFSLGTRYIIESKNRLGAVALANEKMEIIRNLKYDDIGIVGGIPSGNLKAEEDVTESKHAYHVKTLVQYVDDPFDGVSPADVIPTDYKRVKVTVSWMGVNNAESTMFLVARFVPTGIEQASSGGILAVNVIGSDGTGVPQASVHIVNSSVSPQVNTTIMTDNNGNLMLPGAKQSIQSYDITVTKNGYETIETIDPNSVTYSVTDTPASVVEGMLNIKSIVQDKLIDLKITTEDYLGAPLTNVSFDLEGGRILGYDMMYSPAKAIYKLVSRKTANSSGEVKIDDTNPGQFFISGVSDMPGYTLVGMSDFLNLDLVNNKYSVLVAPGESKETKIIFARNDDNSLLLRVVRDADGLPIVGAEVSLANANGFDETQTTKADGVAFFPSASVPLEIGTYDLQVKAEGFADYSGNVDIEKLITQEIKLVAN